MPIEADDTSISVTGRDGIFYAQTCSIKGAIKLEMLGLKHSSGRSVAKHARSIYKNLPAEAKKQSKEGKQALVDELDRRIKAAQQLKQYPERVVQVLLEGE